MKLIKRFFIILIAGIVVLTAAVLVSTSAVQTVEDDGYAMPSGAGVGKSLGNREAEPITLTKLTSEDIVYKALGRSYIGKLRNGIDTAYPSWVRGGSTLRFFNDENILLSAEGEMLPSYEGLYVNAGYTYDENLEQADPDEFLLLVLGNGLFINVQDAAIETRVGDHDIPGNSILQFTESKLSWYSLSGDALVHDEEEVVFEAVIRIGEHRYDYNSLLALLTKLTGAIEGGSLQTGSEDYATLVTEIEAEMTEAEKAAREKDDPDLEDEEMRDGFIDEEEPDDADEDENSDGDELNPESAFAEDTLTSAQELAGANSEDTGEDGASDDMTDMTVDVVVPDPYDGGESEGDKGKTPSVPSGSAGGEGDSHGESGGGGEEDGDRGRGGSGAGSGGSSQSGGQSGGTGSGESGTGGTGGGSGTGASSSGNSGSGTQGGSGQSEQTGQSSQSGQSGAGSGGSGAGNGAGTSTGEEGSGDDVGNESGGNLVPYVDPVVHIENLETWCYALKGTINTEDEAGTIIRGARLTIYGRLDNADHIGKDADGHDVYRANKNTQAMGVLLRKTFTESTDFIMSTLEPDRDIYVQVSFNYREEQKDAQGNTIFITREEIDEYGQKHIVVTEEPLQVKKTYKSDFYKLHTPATTGGDLVRPIEASWHTDFAAANKDICLKQFTFTNTTPEGAAVYDANDTSWENFKRNTLPYVNSMKIELTPVDGNQNRIITKQKQTIIVGKSYMEKIRKESVINYLSTSSVLDSNTRYEYKVTFIDRYDNTVPADIQEYPSTWTEGDAQPAVIDADCFGGYIYTSKAAPRATITIDKNVTDILELSIRLEDTDESLVLENNQANIYLQAIDMNTGTAVMLDGEVLSGDAEFKRGNVSDKVWLNTSTRGATLNYQLRLNSLYFGQSYRLEVIGTYNPRPDSATDAEPALPILVNTKLCEQKVFTAQLSSGLLKYDVNYGTANDNWIQDRKVKLKITMKKESTMNIISMVDIYRIEIKKKGESTPVFSYDLKESELSSIIFDDRQWVDESTKRELILSEKTANTPGITLVAPNGVNDSTNPLMRQDLSVWQVMVPQNTQTEPGEDPIYASAPGVQVELPENLYLDTNTTYTVTMRALVVKGDYEPKDISTDMSNGSFTTKKLHPELQLDDVFLAGDKLVLMDTYISDPDGTIQGEAGAEPKVYVDLYFGIPTGGASDNRLNGTLLDTKTLTPGTAPVAKGTGVNLTFDGIIQDATYTVAFRMAFNNGGGYKQFYYPTQPTEWKRTVTGGSSISGSFTLESLNYASVLNGQTPWTDVMESIKTNGELISITKNGTETTEEASDLTQTPEYDIPEGTTFLQFDDFVRDKNISYLYAYFYKHNANNKSEMTGRSRATVSTGGKAVFLVPEGSEKVMFRVPASVTSLRENGLRIYTLTTGQQNLIPGTADRSKQIINGSGEIEASTSNYYVAEYIPVTPGAVYMRANTQFQANGCYLNFYSKGKTYIGTIYLYNENTLVIPENVYYVSITAYSSDLGFYLVSDVKVGAGYKAEYSVEVTDTRGYLDKDPTRDKQNNQSPCANLQISQSNVIAEPSYTVNNTLSLSLPLKQGSGEEWVIDDGETSFSRGSLNNLEPRTAYKAELLVSYQGNTITLDQETFNTSNPCVLIHNQAEFRGIYNNPYLNYLVVKDFDYTISTAVDFYGTIDFQGHKVTKESDYHFFNILGKSGIIKNLVVEIPAGKELQRGYIVRNHYGTMENIIVRTQGEVTMTGGNALLALFTRPDSVIRNFIIRLGGNAELKSGTNSTEEYKGLVAYITSGIVENGYIYGVNGAGILFSNPIKSIGVRSAIAGYAYPKSIFRNIFVYANAWFTMIDNQPAETRSGVLGSDIFSCTATGMYHVGDYYQYTTKNGRSKNPMETPRTFMRAPSTASRLYRFSTQRYSGEDLAAQAREMSMLYDASWQADTLGSAFDTSCVANGYFPRLILPTCMASQQEYVLMPTPGTAKTPTIVSDAWTDSEAGGLHNDQSGNVTFVVENPSGVLITGMTITSLDETAELIVTVDTDHQSALDYGQNLYAIPTTIQVDLQKDGAEAYYSHYKVKNIKYQADGRTVTSQSGYITDGFEFWKEINDFSDGTKASWSDINKHLDWNYHIVSDIDFTGQNYENVIIDGTTGKADTKAFRGKIDGLYYEVSGEEKIPKLAKLKNITLNELSYSYVIYSITKNSTNQLYPVIRNLVVDNMQITPSASQSSGYAGFINSAESATIENVHIRGGSIKADGIVGALAGYTDYGTCTECSAADITLTDRAGNYAAQFGGLIGHTRYHILNRSYTRDVNISVTGTADIQGVGGLVGENESGTITDCYATGKIKVANGNTGRAGGILGYDKQLANSPSAQTRLYSIVDIDCDSDYVGGTAGVINSRVYNDLAMGNVQSKGENYGRNIGGGNTIGDAHYAYIGQICNMLTESDYKDARELLTYADLKVKDTWLDTVGIGTAFDTSCVVPVKKEVQRQEEDPETHEMITVTEETEGPAYCPMLRSAKGGPVWGQEEIELPGYGGADSMRVVATNYKGSGTQQGTGLFQVQAIITHPGYSHEEFVAMWNYNADLNATDQLGQLHIVIDGMKINEESLGLNNQDTKTAELTMIQNPGGSKDETLLEIKVNESGNLYRRMDTYRMEVDYPACGGGETIKLSAILDFEYQPYWVVENINEWNGYMETFDGINHRDSGENFLITGVVDFSGQSTAYNNLRIGRLKGVELENGEKSGFINLHYAAPETGLPWISSVENPIENIRFEDMSFDFTKTTSSRGSTGAILAGNGLKNVDLSRIVLSVNAKSGAKSGFFSSINGDVVNVRIGDKDNSIPGITINEKGNNATNYCGALAAILQGTYDNVTCYGCTVNKNGTKIGGFVGTQENPTTGKLGTSGNSTFDTIKVKGTTAGCNTYGLIGYYAGPTDDVDIKNITIDAGYNIGGYAYTNSIDGSSSANWKNITVDHATINATNASNGKNGSDVGGLVANTTYYTIRNCSVKNSTITTKGSRAGGLIGYLNSDTIIVDCSVQDTTITVGGSANVAVENRAAGGIAAAGNSRNDFATTNTQPRFKGLSVTGNTTISSPLAAGGIFGAGITSRQVKADGLVVGSGVKVNSDLYAGGVFGSLYQYQATNVSCGATVTGKIAGGFIGISDIQPGLETYRHALSYGTFNCKVNGSQYAGGLVGLLNSSSEYFAATAEDDSSGTKIMNGLVVAGSVVGGTANACANQLTGYAGDLDVVLCEDLLVNGQQLRALNNLTNITGDNNYNVPAHGRLVPASDFAEVATYTGMGFSSGNVDFTPLTTSGVTPEYMPYVLYDKKVIKNAVDAVPLPEPGDSIDTVVYASGVDTINVESTTEYINVNGTDYNTSTTGFDKVKRFEIPTGEKDADGNPITEARYVLTLGYDFNSSVTVNNKTWLADNLARSVMTAGSNWYYIAEDNTIHYGTDKEPTEPQMVSVGGTPVHLWQGKALANGQVYNISGGSASNAGSAKGNLVPCDAAQPFISDQLVTSTNTYGLSVYYGFTVGMGSDNVEKSQFGRVHFREIPYCVSPNQGSVYDGVILNSENRADGVVSYFSLLGSDGKIHDQLSATNLGIIETYTNTGAKIRAISNYVGYSGSAVLAEFEDGTILGVNYFNGETLIGRIPATTSLKAYAMSKFAELKKDLGFVDEDDYIDDEPSPLADENGLVYLSRIVGDSKRNGAEEGIAATDVNENEGTLGDVEDATEYGDPDALTGETDNEAEAEEPVGAEDPQYGEKHERDGGPEGGKEISFVPGEGLYLDGELYYSPTRAIYVRGVGVYVDGVLCYVENADGQLTPVGNGQAAKGEPTAVSEGTAMEANFSENMTLGATLAQLTGGMAIGYDAEEGKYLPTEITELASGEKKAPEAKPVELSAPIAPTVEAVDNFAVGQGLSHKLTSAEKRGFALLIGISGTALVVLAVLYFVSVRRKKGNH